VPYIKFRRRGFVEPSSWEGATSAGELNYQITSLLVEYVLANGLSYQTINDIQGSLRNAGVEFDRRITGRYEKKKIKENGDVYAPLLPLLKGQSPPKEQEVDDAQDDDTIQEARDSARRVRGICGNSYCDCGG
jgi:hypothetical protein